MIGRRTYNPRFSQTAVSAYLDDLLRFACHSIVHSFPINIIRDWKGGRGMRVFMLALGKDAAGRVQDAIGKEAAILCPTLQRLASAGKDDKDIVIAKQGGKTEGKRIIELRDGLRKRTGKAMVASGPRIALDSGFSEEELLEAINAASSMTSESAYLRAELAGSSAVMEKVRTQIEKAMKTALPVHLIGDTGTGKTVAAGLIHRYSSSKPLVAESCGLLSSSLAESLLFGHTKDAYSGSSTMQTGLIAQADGSTLFLDELQDLSLQMQAMLLQVLDTGEYRRLGSGCVHKSSLRLITASNVSQKELLRTHRLRRDFYYRISCIEIRMPSLSEHPEDIPEIIASYEAKKGYSKTIEDTSPFMRDYPGNVRELIRDVELYHHGLMH